MKISIRHLEIFSAVAKYKSIKKAAEALFLSQSAVSMALTEFEKKIGVKLFDRVSRRLILNNYGEEILTEANAILQQVKELENIFKENKIRGSLSIGGTQTIGNYVLPKVVGEFKKNYPSVNIFLYIDNTENILKKLLNFEIDLAFIEGIVNSSQVRSIKWIEDEIVIFSTYNHPLASKNSVSFKQLENERWILREKGSGTRDIFEKSIYGKIDNLNIYLEVNQTEAIKHIVKEGIGLGALSILTIKQELATGIFKQINIPIKITREFKILIHKKKFSTKALDTFIKFAKSIY